jgi:esterase/lipase superfamily enzyme
MWFPYGHHLAAILAHCCPRPGGQPSSGSLSMSSFAFACAIPSGFCLRRVAGLFGAAGLLFALAACTQAPGKTSASPGNGDVSVSAISGEPALTVVTTRNPVKAARSSPWFGTERANQASQARVKLTTPQQSSFASVGMGDWGIAGVEAIPVGEGLSRGNGRRDVLIYVHGFNQSFETATLDAARLSDGIRFRGETMLFSWPSKGSVTDYIYDRESAMWSRDAFEAMLEQLIADPDVGRINIVAHSMGTMLTVEVLRQLSDRRGAAVAGRFGAIVLAAPDIDFDVFAASVNRIGPLTDKVTVLIASNDRALDVMRRLAGGVTRVGAAEAEKLQALGLRVIDASKVGKGAINHDLFLSDARVREQVRLAIDKAPGAPAYAGAASPAPSSDFNP